MGNFRIGWSEVNITPEKKSLSSANLLNVFPNMWKNR